MKRRYSRVIVLALVIALSVPVFASADLLRNFEPEYTYKEGQFRDVPSDSWYFPNVKLGYELGLINGKSLTSFDPKGNLTLAEAVKLSVSVHSIYYGRQSELNTGAAYPWYKPYVEYAETHNMVRAGIENYGKTATRLEFATILATALPPAALKQINTVEDKAIPDINETMDGYREVYRLYRAGILTGSTKEGDFLPSNPIARSEVSAIITRMVDTSLRKEIELLYVPEKILSAKEIAEKCSPGVFYIEVYDMYGDSLGSGSGFFIESSGLAVTNYHVIEGGHSATIYTADGKSYDVEGVCAYDIGKDVALIQIGGRGFTALAIGKRFPDTGDTIYTIGSPEGLDNTMSHGLVSNANRVFEDQRYIQISAPISPGSSGGALINDRGEVIGITAAGYMYGQNLNFAIPISAIENMSGRTPVPLADILPKPEIDYPVSVDVSSFSIAAGRSRTLYMTSENRGELANYMYSYVGDARDYVEFTWGDWNDDYTTTGFIIEGLKPGKAQIELWVADTMYNRISPVITVDITVLSGVSYVDPEEMVLQIGEVGTATFYSLKESARTASYEFEGSGGDHADAWWGGWNDGGTRVPLYIEALKAGKVRVLLWEKDAGGNKIGGFIPLDIFIQKGTAKVTPAELQLKVGEVGQIKFSTMDSRGSDVYHEVDGGVNNSIGHTWGMWNADGTERTLVIEAFKPDTVTIDIWEVDIYGDRISEIMPVKVTIIP